MISPTTAYQVYNTLGTGANWYANRWGPRPVTDLDLDWSAISHLDHFNLVCFYGDPQCWQGFQHCVLSGKFIMAETYMPPGVLAENVHWIINVDGMNELGGLVYLGQRWQDIAYQVKQIPDQVTIKFAVWHHNIHQIEQITEWCQTVGCKLELVTGDHNSDEWSPVINDRSDWLYCVKHADPDNLPDQIEPKLYRHLESYNSLRTFVKPPNGKSIIDNPLITPYDPVPEWTLEFQSQKIDDQGSFWAPSGHQFNNSVLWGQFMMLLASDWKFDRKTVESRRHDKWFQEQVFWARQVYQAIQ